MRIWIPFLAAAVTFAMAQTGFAQRSSQQSGQQSGQQSAGGAAGGGTGFGTGGSPDQLLTDPDAVFEIDRGNTVGASASNVEGFSTVGGAGSAQGSRGGALGGGAFGGGLGALGGLFGGANPFNMGQQQQSSKRIRTRLRAEIDAARPPAPRVESRIEQRWANFPAEPRFRDVQIEMRGRTAVLNGEVETAKDRRMAELLLRLEPGVSEIENGLLVAGELPADAVGAPDMVPVPAAE